MHRQPYTLWLVSLCLLGGCAQEPVPSPAHLRLTEAQARPLTDRTFTATSARLERGRYLVEGVLRCYDCHSLRNWEAPGAPPVVGMAGAGDIHHASSDTLIVAPNLTPDAETGIGTWTDDMLARAIREGVGHDGRVLSWEMPSSSFRYLADEDLASVIVFLRSLPSVRNALPASRLPVAVQEEVASQLQPLTEPVLAPNNDDLLERGRYLVTLANCEGCHTSWHSSRNPGLLGGGNHLTSGERRVFSTNITPHASGVAYDAERFITVMRTGKGGTLHPFMPWAAYGHMTDEDLTAIHTLLRSIQPVAHYVNNAVPPTPCAACGQEHGLGEINTVERPTAAAVDPAPFDDYVGTYRSVDFGWTVHVTRDGDTLYAQEADGPVAELIPQSATRFLMLGGLVPVRFERDGTSQVVALVSEEVQEVSFERINEPGAQEQ